MWEFEFFLPESSTIFSLMTFLSLFARCGGDMDMPPRSSPSELFICFKKESLDSLLELTSTQSTQNIMQKT